MAKRGVSKPPAPKPVHPGMFTLKAVAEMWDVSYRTVQSWVASGRLEVLHLSPRTVRVTKDAIARFEAAARRRP